MGGEGEDDELTEEDAWLEVAWPGVEGWEFAACWKVRESEEEMGKIATTLEAALAQFGVTVSVNGA